MSFLLSLDDENLINACRLLFFASFVHSASAWCSGVAAHLIRDSVWLFSFLLLLQVELLVELLRGSYRWWVPYSRTVGLGYFGLGSFPVHNTRLRDLKSARRAVLHRFIRLWGRVPGSTNAQLHR